MAKRVTTAGLEPVQVAVGERILLTGASGQVGGEVARLLAPVAEVIAPSRAELDLSDEAAVRALVRRVRPRWIVNPAAYTAVDRAESEPELAYAINAAAVRALGEEASAIGAAVVHFSTDYVFDGAGTSPYTETDPARPSGVYGASKLAGEQELARSGAAHVILRTSWVYGATGKNFLLTILKAARERDRLRVVADQHGAPTWSRDLARLTAHLIGRCERRCEGRCELHVGATGAGELAEEVARVGGLYHTAGAGETTWYGFAAEAIRQQRQSEPGTAFAEIDPITTAEYPTPARRPQNSRLDCRKLATTFDWTMMRWEDSLRAVLAEL
ncbi:MAG TPA: dTDP-4-dehydrorhamnose reductase [Granulicella sp.]|jgi:dTDP-4-dehydrorhamnose reductase|nr:dTDP-4-dehydrorhamnose reductase [Granulicella sp.]